MIKQKSSFIILYSFKDRMKKQLNKQQKATSKPKEMSCDSKKPYDSNLNLGIDKYLTKSIIMGHKKNLSNLNPNPQLVEIPKQNTKRIIPQYRCPTSTNKQIQSAQKKKKNISEIAPLLCVQPQTSQKNSSFPPKPPKKRYEKELINPTIQLLSNNKIQFEQPFKKTKYLGQTLRISPSLKKDHFSKKIVQLQQNKMNYQQIDQLKFQSNLRSSNFIKNINIQPFRARKPIQKIVQKHKSTNSLKQIIIQYNLQTVEGSNLKENRQQNQLKGRQFNQKNIDRRFQVKNPKNYPYSSIGFLVFNRGFQNYYAGTGVLVGPNLVLTAAHNVRASKNYKKLHYQTWDEKKYNQKQGHFYLGVQGNIESAARKLQIKQIYYPKQFEQIQQENKTQIFDYAILELQTQEDLTLQFGSLGIQTQWLDITQNVYVFGYPQDKIKSKVLKDELSQKKNYAFLFGQIGKIYEISGDKKMLRYFQITTSEGQSGCPLFVESGSGDGLYNIIGIHRGKQNCGYNGIQVNIGVKITQQVFNRLKQLIGTFEPKAIPINWRYTHEENQIEFIQFCQQSRWDEIVKWVERGKKLNEMQKLSLRNKQIRQMVKLNIISLQQLELNYNLIQGIKGLSKLYNLKKLFLDNNKIVEIKNLIHLKSLQQLWLQDNLITQIKNLGGLTKLKLLFLRNNKIQKIKGLKELIELKKLYLTSNKIQKIQNLNNLVSLKQLNLNDNSILRIENLSNLQYLQILQLQNNQIYQIQNLNQLTSLKSLNLENNQIHEIKNLNLPSLQILSLGRNQIEQLKGLDKLNSLNTLNLYCNKIIEIKNLSRLPCLGYINLTDNKLWKGANLQNEISKLQEMQVIVQIQ